MNKNENELKDKIVELEKKIEENRKASRDFAWDNFMINNKTLFAHTFWLVIIGAFVFVLFFGVGTNLNQISNRLDSLKSSTECVEWNSEKVVGCEMISYHYDARWANGTVINNIVWYYYIDNNDQIISSSIKDIEVYKYNVTSQSEHACSELGKYQYDEMKDIIINKNTTCKKAILVINYGDNK